MNGLSVSVNASRGAKSRFFLMRFKVSRKLSDAFRGFKRFGCSTLRLRDLTGSLPALERRFIAPPIHSRKGIVAGQSSTGHGAPALRVGVERRDILRRYTSAARLGVIGETQAA